MGNANKKRVVVDADACPSLNLIIRIALEHKTPVVLVGNETQNLQRFAGMLGVSIMEVSRAKDAADHAIFLMISPGDIVVTADIGLASLVLSKRAVAFSPRGKVYNPTTIDSMLLLRQEGQKIRRAGGKTKGPRAYDMEDAKRLQEALRKLLSF